MNIIITSAGRRVSLVRKFQNEAKSRVSGSKVYTCDLNPYLSSACNISDGYFEVPPATEKDYINDLLEICSENDINIVVPTIDTELLILAENRSKFISNGVEVIISNPEFISICRDKRATHKFFDQHGIDRALDVDMKNPLFPFFVKPYDGSCSDGAYLVNSENMISKADLDNPKNMFLEYLDPTEYVEFTIDLYYNRDSHLICCIPRRRIEVRAGEVNKGITNKNFLIPFMLNKLRIIKGVRGCINVQVFVNMKTEKIIGIEINPRFGGGFPLSYMAGANFPKWIIDEYIYQDKLEYYDGWEDKLLMLRFDDEVVIHDYSR